MSISRSDVISCYQAILGREPEGENVINFYSKSCRSFDELRQMFLNSSEFKNNFQQKNVCVSLNSPSAKSISSDFHILLIGNCQARFAVELLNAIAPVNATHILSNQENLFKLFNGFFDKEINSSSLIIFFGLPVDLCHVTSLVSRYPDIKKKVRTLPVIFFSAFHPDCDYVYDVRHDKTNLAIKGPMVEYQSALAFWAYTHGYKIKEATRLFREDVFSHLQYFNIFHDEIKILLNIGVEISFPLEDLLLKWIKTGCFMHSINHPKFFVLADIVRAFLNEEGVPNLPLIEHYMRDGFVDGPCWPVYPEIAERIGLKSGSYYFKKPGSPPCLISLEEFVAGSFDCYAKFEQGNLCCPRISTTPFQTLSAYLDSKRRSFNSVGFTTKRSESNIKGNPYHHLSESHFWSKSVARMPLDDIDPVVNPKFVIAKNEKLATAGSCFAQHISRRLASEGFNYFVAERAPESLAEADRANRNYGIFSARYGNIYTARQLVQLFDRAHDRFMPQEAVWLRADGRFVDPFRPQIEPSGFENESEMQASRVEHLNHVREMFASLDVLVFTLGLTESWECTIDGAVMPLAPGVAGGQLDNRKHRFRNFSVNEIIDDIEIFLLKLLGVNPQARVLITVSPVPLVATYENQHVLVSNTHSKSILRTAASEIANRYANCDYFPSYEIITGQHAGNIYYEKDLRSVTQQGVNHVMKVFLNHYTNQNNRNQSAELNYCELANQNTYKRISGIICEEEAIER